MPSRLSVSTLSAAAILVACLFPSCALIRLPFAVAGGVVEGTANATRKTAEAPGKMMRERKAKKEALEKKKRAKEARESEQQGDQGLQSLMPPEPSSPPGPSDMDLPLPEPDELPLPE